MAYTAQNLEHAVSVFYSSDHSDRAEAHKWLTTAQRCPEAWSFVWELLQSQKGTEIQFFAATTLHTKLQRCWAEVPPDKYEELKSRILEAISMFSRGPKIVLNRLCISLAAFLLQQGGRGLLEAVEPLLSSENATIILEILSVVPEEFNTMTMSANNRSVVRNNLQQMTPQILELVTKHLCIDSQRSVANGEDWSRKVGVWQSSCQCAGAWLELGGVVPSDCASVLTAALRILHTVYWGQYPNQTARRELTSPEFEACESALGVASAALTQPDAGKFSTSCQPLLRMLLDAVEPLLVIEDVVHTSNDELIGAIYGVVVAVGECHAQWIASALAMEDTSPQVRHRGAENGDDDKQLRTRREATQCAKDLMKLILRCSDALGNYPTQETHSQLAFGFWYILQDEALRDIPETVGSGCYVKIALRGWYEQLANALLRKSTLLPPPATYSAEDAELMRCYRQDIADILLYCYEVLGPALLQQLGLLLGQLSAAVSDQGDSLASAQLEAVLHAFQALGESAGAGGGGTPTLLLRTLLGLPFHTVHHQLLITALDCFSAYAEWLGSEEAGETVSELVGGALGVACTALSVPNAAPRAALALRSLTRECNSLLAPHAITLLTAIRAGQSGWSGAVGVKVMGAAGSAAAALPAATAAPHVAALINPLLSILQVTQRPQLSNSEIEECSCALHQGASLLGAMCGAGAEHAHVPLSLLLPVLPHTARHSLLAEPLFALIKLIITNLMDECIPLLPDLNNILNIGLEGEPHPAAIDVAKLMSLMFPEVCGSILSVSAAAVVRVCQSGLERGRPLSELSPLLDSLFSALAAASTKKPQLLDHMQYQLQNIIQLGILAISLPEQGPCRAGCCFLSQLARVRPADLLPQAPTLVQRTVHCIGVLSPRSHIDPFAEVLLGLGRAQWEDTPLGAQETLRGPGQLAAWLKDALQHPGFPSDQATPQVKEKFIKAVIKNHAHKRRLIEVVREFALACRGLLGEYGQMTQASNLF